MAKTRINEILDAILARLGTISVANGYRTDVAEVTYHSRVGDEVRLRPTLGLHKGIVSYTHYHGDVLRCECVIYVDGHITADTPAARVEAVEDLTDDVIAALYSDYTFGDEAITMTLSRSEDSLGEPAETYNRKPVADCTVELMVKWDRSTGASP